jgi:predicted GIY-YIG superfamily endonuclease
VRGPHSISRFPRIQGLGPIPKLVPDKEYYNRFWTHLVDGLTELDPWYARFKIGNQKVSGWNTGKPGIGFWFRLRSRYLQATVTIEDTGIDRIEYYWDQLKEKQIYIDSELPIKPKWKPAEGKTTASRIGTKVPHSGWDKDSWWDDIIEPIKQIMDGYRKVILPFIDTLEDLTLTHFYAIQILDDSDNEVVWKGGITNHLNGRLKQHIRDFSKHPASSSWKLSLIDSVDFETEPEARKFETEMKATDNRAPSILGLSTELFRENPIEWARENKRING